MSGQHYPLCSSWMWHCPSPLSPLELQLLPSLTWSSVSNSTCRSASFQYILQASAEWAFLYKYMLMLLLWLNPSVACPCSSQIKFNTISPAYRALGDLLLPISSLIFSSPPHTLNQTGFISASLAWSYLRPFQQAISFASDLSFPRLCLSYSPCRCK